MNDLNHGPLIKTEEIIILVRRNKVDGLQSIHSVVLHLLLLYSEVSKYSVLVVVSSFCKSSPNHTANPVNKLTACRRICFAPPARQMHQTSFLGIHDGETNKRDSSSAHPIIQFNRPAPSSHRHRDPLQRRIKTESCSLSVQAEF